MRVSASQWTAFDATDTTLEATPLPKGRMPNRAGFVPFGHRIRRGRGDRTSSEVRAHHVHQLIRSLSTLGSTYRRRTREMAFDVLFHHLDHQAIDSPSNGRNLLQHLGTAALSPERALQRLDLAANAAHPGQKLSLSAYRMTHETNPKNTIRGIVSEACRRVQDATLIEK